MSGTYHTLHYSIYAVKLWGILNVHVHFVSCQVPNTPSSSHVAVWAGVFLLVVPDTRSGKTSPNSLLILTACISLRVLTSSSWRDISGNTTRALSLSFRHPITVTDAGTKLRLWKWTIQLTRAVRKRFMTIVNCKYAG